MDRPSLIPSLIVTGVAVCAVGPIAAYAGVTPGQVDNFQDGTTLGWSVGGAHPAPPANVADGGPGGMGDAYLRLTATGGQGSGSRFAAFNSTQWAGDYTSAGGTGLSMDVQNLGPDDAFLRLRFWDPVGGNIAITEGAFVPAGSGWVSIAFAVDAASLTALTGTAAGAVSNAAELRLFHNPSPDYPLPPIGPPPVSLVLGVDNIRAVPGPAAPVLAALALGGAVGWRRRR